MAAAKRNRTTAKHGPKASAPSADGADLSPDAVFVVDAGRIVRANAAACALCGGEALVGKELSSVVAPGETDRFAKLERQRADGWPLPETHRMRFVRDGAVVIADVRWRRLSSERLVLAARDVNDLTRAESLIGRLARLPLGLDGAIALLDASEPVFLALEWTVAFTEVLPGGSITHRILSPPGDPVGAYGRTLVGHVVPRSATPVLDRVATTGEPLFADNLSPDPTEPLHRAIALSDSMTRSRVARSAWCPIRRDRDVSHLLAVTGRDVTEHDFVAIQLFAAQLGAALRLEGLRASMVQRERLVAVGAMAAMLAHEVRNPLGIMFNALGGLRRTLGPLGEETAQLLGILQQEADRLKRLVHDLLEFASPHVAVCEPIALAPVVSEALRAASFDEAFERQKPALSVDVEEGTHVRADAALLRRALLNLLVNAYQHVKPSGRVRVEARRAPDHRVALSVFNEGVPPPDAVRARMFEPFFTTKSSGTGLGLAIVERLAHDLQARVVSLAIPDGALFVLDLPEAEPPT